MKFLNNFNYLTNTVSFNILFNKNYKNFNNNFKYKLKFIKNSIFFKKTNKGKNFNLKLISKHRNNNFNLNNLLINSWVKKGLKLNFLKHYNLYVCDFIYIITKNKFFFKNYPNFNFINVMLQISKFNYNVINLVFFSLKTLEYMFDLKLKKLNKQMKKKHKKKYMYTVKYLQQSKRLKHTLNMFYSSSNYYNEKQYSKRIFNTFLYIIFDTKKTPIWDKKINIYKMASKFFKKK